VTPTVSIVIPTYNPQERSFLRVLTAVGVLLVQPDVNVECVIVDNRSTPPLQGLEYVRAFLDKHNNARLVREETQGLTFARLAGIKATRGDVVVVFDDDNVPAPEYLRVVAGLVQQYPFVAVWGPGNIDVELLDRVPARLERRVKGHHGLKSSQFAQYASVPETWLPSYPFGLGQVIRRDVADGYRRAVESGQLTASDRRGDSLASAGDCQIVWHAINMGLAAGTHPDLRLLHLIPGSRSTTRYLRRLIFGCAVSHYLALAQSFPSRAEGWRRHVPTLPRFGIQVSKVVMESALRNRLRFLSIDLAELLGEWCGHMSVAGRENHWTFTLARRLGLN
jgi:hypothetical protein